jgi:hypothetical protein
MQPRFNFRRRRHYQVLFEAIEDTSDPTSPSLFLQRQLSYLMEVGAISRRTMSSTRVTSSAPNRGHAR